VAWLFLILGAMIYKMRWRHIFWGS